LAGFFVRSRLDVGALLNDAKRMPLKAGCQLNKKQKGDSIARAALRIIFYKSKKLVL
jgi:hypothetical protein